MSKPVDLPVDFKVPWSGRGHLYTQEEIDAVVEAMKTADPQTQGRYQNEFEKRFAEYVGASHAFALTSCTAALEISAMLCRLKPGDEVILPAHTFAASAIPFGRTGAKLVWADIDPETLVVTADTIRPLITPKTKVLVVVHLYGLSADMDPIMELAREHGLLVVEDVAQAIGARYKGRRLGTIGDFGCYSFHTHKNMSTLGEGGMLTVKDPALAAHVPGLRHNGVRPFEGARPKYWVPAMSNIDFDWDGIWPYNFCIGEVQCALGIQLLKRLDKMNADRLVRAQAVKSRLADLLELKFQKTPDGCGHAYHLLPVRYDGTTTGGNRDQFIETIAFQHGVKAIVQYYPLYRYPMFQKAGFGDARCPNTDVFFDNMISFPFHHGMTEEQMDHMVESIRSTCLSLRARRGK